MNPEKIRVINTLNGQISEESPKLLNNPNFKGHLVPVTDEAKSYLPGLYASKTAEEFVESSPRRAAKPKPAPNETPKNDEKDED